MYSRLLSPPKGKSFFLFGPRGTGKTTWARQTYPKALFFDLLAAENLNPLLANPQRLSKWIPDKTHGPVVIDEIQKVPALLDEVHRLIETRRISFVLTGSSARKLRRGGVNLLAGRALTYTMHPLSAFEMGDQFSLSKALRFGMLPAAQIEPDPKKFLDSYVKTYLDEEVRQEGLTRHMDSFARFLEATTFSQGSLLNISRVAEDCHVNRKVAEDYFQILQDLLISHQLPVFTKRAKRRLVAHPKFYLFDTGVFRNIRPAGPLDTVEESEGPALETLVLQNILAINDGMSLDYNVFYWRTADGKEVDFVLYGPRGLLAIEVKRSHRLDRTVLSGLNSFLSDYPVAKAYLVYGGERVEQHGQIQAVPLENFLKSLPDYLSQNQLISRH